MISSFHSFAETIPSESVSIVEKVLESVWAEIKPNPEMYPQFFIYGLEVEASAGVSDVAEIGSSLVIEFHFERITN